MSTSRRKLNKCATLSSPRCMLLLVVLPLVACPVVPLVEPLVPVLELVAPLDPPSRKSIKLIHWVLCITRNTFHCITRNTFHNCLILIIPHCYKSCDFVVGTIKLHRKTHGMITYQLLVI